MADKTNQQRIYVETDYDNIILIDPNKIVVGDKIEDRLVDHEDLVFFLETIKIGFKSIFPLII